MSYRSICLHLAKATVFFLALCLATSPAHAELDLNLTLTSDYIFRGVSQTDEEPTIQAGIEYSNASGFYVGLWASPVDFGSEAELEVDAYLGFSRELKNGFEWDIGLIHYNYPDESDLNFEEIYLGVGYEIFSAKYSYSDDLGGDSANYLEVALDFPLPKDFGLHLHVGSTEFSDDLLEDFYDYRFAVSKSTSWLDIEVAYTDTDTDQFGDLGDRHWVLSLSKDFSLSK